MAGTEATVEGLTALISRVDDVLRGSSVLSLKDLAVSGDDLIAVGVKPGKPMGIILHELLETVVDDPNSNNRETLLRVALRFNEKYQPRV
jgi:poly(A) polymerase/tRNA nucleotidyltransferase (CCA-adding enzyme)